MKTMANQDNSAIIRVTEREAEILQYEGFRYVSKEMYKKNVRDTDQPAEDKLIEVKSNKMSKSAKRHLRKQNKND